MATQSITVLALSNTTVCSKLAVVQIMEIEANGREGPIFHSRVKLRPNLVTQD